MRPDSLDLSDRLKALEAERLPTGEARFLFGLAPSAVPPLHALASEEEELARAAHAVCRRCKDVVCHVFEFAHDPLEALSFLACHGWPTPLLDLSASAEFALRHCRGSVTVVDRARLPEHAVTCDSGFLAHCSELKGPPARWLERRGLTLTHAEWRNYDTAADFDLGEPGFAGAVSRIETHRHAAATPSPLLREPDPVLHENLRAAIRTAGRKILGAAGVSSIEVLLARYVPE